MYTSEDQSLIFAHCENSYSKGETSRNIDPKIYQKSFLGAWLPIRGTDRFQTLLWPGDTEGRVRSTTRQKRHVDDFWTTSFCLLAA